MGLSAFAPSLSFLAFFQPLRNGLPAFNFFRAAHVSSANPERRLDDELGYLKWRVEQEAVLENRLNQDHLLDFLRRDDAPELPEVGLQAAATRLSQLLLQKLAHAQDPEANLDNYSKLIDLLCRLNREISATQKARDASRRTLGRDYDPVLVKDVDHVSAIEIERHYSDPPPASKLPKPDVPPLLPQIPTATFLAEETLEKQHDEERLRAEKAKFLMQSFGCKKSASQSQQSASPTTENHTSHSA
jgi:hypothetical protein